MKFVEHFQSQTEKLCSKLSEEQNLRKVAESLYIFLITPDKVDRVNMLMRCKLF